MRSSSYLLCSLTAVRLPAAAGRAGEGPEAGVSHRSDPGQAARPGGEQPAGGHRDAAEADAEQPDHRVLLCAG